MYKSFIIISIYSKHTPRCLHKVKRNNNKPIKQVGIEESVGKELGSVRNCIGTVTKGRAAREEG